MVLVILRTLAGRTPTCYVLPLSEVKAKLSEIVDEVITTQERVTVQGRAAIEAGDVVNQAEVEALRDRLRARAV